MLWGSCIVVLFAVLTLPAVVNYHLASGLPFRARRDLINIEGYQPISISNLIDSVDFFNLNETLKGTVCLPGSHFYNGSCIFFSNDRQKLSWTRSKKFCHRLHLNSSLLILKNQHLLDFVYQKIVKLKRLEEPADPLSFNIGFSRVKKIWRWIDGIHLDNSSEIDYNITEYWSDETGTFGECGGMVLLRTNKLAFQSRPCLSSESRFICEYNLNPCYMNNICGKHGKCVNLLKKVYCDCSAVSMFYTGRYCEKFNTKAVQSIIAILLVCACILYIIYKTSFSKMIFFALKSKIKRSIETRSRFEKPAMLKSGEKPGMIDQLLNAAKNTTTATTSEGPRIEDKIFETNPFEAQFKENTEPSKPDRNVGKILHRWWTNAKQRLSNRHNVIAFLFHFLMIGFLVLMQVSFVHFQFNTSILRIVTFRNVSSKIDSACQRFEKYFAAEDLFYTLAGALLLLLISATYKRSRFSKYITNKYKQHQISLYKYHVMMRKSNVKKNPSSSARLVDSNKQDKRSRKHRKAGGCCDQSLFRSCINCFFYCSCCYSPGERPKIFRCLYCCIPKKIRRLLDCIRLCKRVSSCCSKEELTSENEPKEFETINSTDEFFLREGDYNPRNQKLNWRTFPVPMPFSTVNRRESVAAYVAYAYDLLNIFLSYFAANFEIGLVSFFAKPTGVLHDFVLQIIQIAFVGLKFYPILVISDMPERPHWLIYVLCTIHLCLIMGGRFINKAFCSRVTAIYKIAKDNIAEYDKRFNITPILVDKLIKVEKKILTKIEPGDDGGLEGDSLSYSRRKRSSNVFEEFFGPNNQPYETRNNFDDLLAMSLFNETTQASLLENTPFFSSFSSTSVPNSMQQLNPITPEVSYVKRLPPGQAQRLPTRKIIYDLKNQLIGKQTTSYVILEIAENLPFYLAISYLIARYGLLSFNGAIKFLMKIFKRLKELFPSRSYESNISLAGSELSDSEQDEPKVLIPSNDDYKCVPTQKLKNPNYEYIYNLFARNFKEKESEENPSSRDLARSISRTKRLSRSTSTQKSKLRAKAGTSFMLNLFEKYIYRKVPHMKYSKQMINTFTMAFMCVYFFTTFGFRFANLYERVLSKFIYFIYRYIVGDSAPKQRDDWSSSQPNRLRDRLHLSESEVFDKLDLSFQFKMAFFTASCISLVQLFNCLSQFHSDLNDLNTNKQASSSSNQSYAFSKTGRIAKIPIFIGNSALNYNDLKKKKSQISSMIISDSLHFSGYLISHLIIGYFFIFLFCLSIFVLFKVTSFFPGALQQLSQIVLPIMIILGVRMAMIELTTRAFFFKTKRITNMIPYSILAHFNFFFDCFLGLIGSLRQMGQAYVISLLMYIRIDKSVFDKNNYLVMKYLDKGHLAYMCYLKMEHWYNNQVVNGFCELIIEASLRTKIFIADADKDDRKFFKKIKETQTDKGYETSDKEFKLKPAPIRLPPGHFTQPQLQEWTKKIRSDPNKLKAFLRLRNIFYLCMLLQDNQILCTFRFHKLDNFLHQISESSNIETWTHSFFRNINRVRMKLHTVSSKKKTKKKRTN